MNSNRYPKNRYKLINWCLVIKKFIWSKNKNYLEIKK